MKYVPIARLFGIGHVAVAVPLTTDPATVFPTCCAFWLVIMKVTVPSFTVTAEVTVAVSVTV
jgi:hypothetical protein